MTGQCDDATMTVTFDAECGPPAHSNDDGNRAETGAHIMSE